MINRIAEWEPSTKTCRACGRRREMPLKGQVTTSLGWRALYLQNDEEIQDKLLPAIPDQMPGVAESVDVFSRKSLSTFQRVT